MNLEEAVEIVRALAHGKNPTTGEILPIDSLTRTPEITEALFIVLSELNRQATGVIKSEPKEQNKDIHLPDDLEKLKRKFYKAKDVKGRLVKCICPVCDSEFKKTSSTQIFYCREHTEMYKIALGKLGYKMDAKREIVPIS